MSGLDKFFEKKEPPVHPKVSFWQSVLKNKKDGIERLRVTFLREKEDLVFGPAKLFVHFCDAADEQIRTPDEVDWDERINAELVKLRARAISIPNETERFGMVLTDRLARAVNRFSDTFFNAVLVTYLKQSAFAELPASKSAIDELHEYNPSPGMQKADCQDMIEEAIGYCIDSLHGPLDYPKAETTSIVAGAVAYYLDERFSISDRKSLGLTW